MTPIQPIPSLEDKEAPRVFFKTNAEEAAEMLARANAIEWDTRDYALVDRIRAHAARLLERPDELYIPF